MKYIYKILFVVINAFESFFWHVKREVLLSQLGKCGKNVWIGRWQRIMPKNVFIGNDVSIGNGVIMQSTGSRIIIGNHVMFGPNVSIHGGNHRIDVLGRSMKSIKVEEKRAGIDDADVIIEDDVWIGNGVVILMGVVIGQGSVIGAGVVVYKSVPPYSIVTGAKMEIRKRFTDEQIEEHERILCQNKNL